MLITATGVFPDNMLKQDNGRLWKEYVTWSCNVMEFVIEYMTDSILYMSVVREAACTIGI